MRRSGVVTVVAAGAALPVFGSAGGPISGEALITPQIGTIFWTLVTFVLLLFVLKRLAWKPLLDALESREGQIRADIEQAKKDRDEALKILEENRQILAQSRRERAEAVEAGRRDAERLKEEILDEARRQREHLLEQASAQIQAEVRQAKSDLRGTATDLAIRAAERLLARNLDEPSQRRLVEDYLNDLERLPPDSASRPS